MGLVFSEVYPGSISDTEITEKTNILDFVTEDHEVMSDKGFSIQDICAIKGVSLNRPKQKDTKSGGFPQQEIHTNFDTLFVEIFARTNFCASALRENWKFSRVLIFAHLYIFKS